MHRFQQTNKALGSEAYITLVDERAEAEINKIFDDLWLDIFEFQHRFSRFEKDSELTNLNSSAGIKFKASKQMIDILKKTKELSEYTKGVFNPFVLPILQTVGYVGSWPNVSSSDENTDFRSRNITSFKKLEVNDDWVRIPKNSAIDLGGIGKGYLLDMLALKLDDRCSGYWISLGGDIISYGHDVDGRNWQIDIASANTNDSTVATYINKSKGLSAIATSGTIKRAGKGWNHLINPATGKSTTSEIKTATVLSESAVEADVLAKTLVIIGQEEALKFYKQKNLRGVLLQFESLNTSENTVALGELIT